MNDRLFLRRDTLSLTAILTLPWLTGNLYSADILPEVVWDAMKVVLLPAWFLDHELQTTVVRGGVGGLYTLFISNNGWHTPTISLLWGIGLILLVTYTASAVSIYVGMLLASAVDVVPDEPWRRAVVGIIVTFGVVSLVATTSELLMADPTQRQTFHPKGVAGSLTLVILGIVVLMLHQKTSVT